MMRSLGTRMNTTDPSEILGEGRFVRLRRLANGWECVDRINAAHIVTVVAVTPDDCLVLVDQMRPPVGAAVIELPAGLVGDQPGAEDEDWLAAAQRELEEETGFVAARWSTLTSGPPSSGLTSEIITFYLAQDLTRTGPGGGDNNEDITVHTVPLAGIDAWLEERVNEGHLLDPKVYTALYFLHGRSFHRCSAPEP